MTLLEKLQTSGIRRDGTPKSGFRYRHANGKPVTAAEAERIAALKLPPAWTEVRIDPKPRAHLVAVGKDKAGRWQYRYHEAFREKQEAQKFERIVEFAEALPAMRAARIGEGAPAALEGGRPGRPQGCAGGAAAPGEGDRTRDAGAVPAAGRPAAGPARCQGVEGIRRSA